MSENVVSLTGVPVHSSRRDEVMLAVAQSFDYYVEQYGCEPDAIVYVLCGIKQPSHIAWDIRGESEAGVTSVLSISAVHCQAEAASSRQGLKE